jgi:hypothetical protein
MEAIVLGLFAACKSANNKRDNAKSKTLFIQAVILSMSENSIYIPKYINNYSQNLYEAKNK